MRRRIGLTAVAAALALIAIVGFGEGRSLPIERQMSLPLAGWPPRTPPLRIALLSDIYSGWPITTRARLDAVVAAVNRAKPDLILLAGDFVNGHGGGDVTARAEMLVAPLRALTPRLGTIAVLGNHDHWTSRDTVIDALRRAGVTVLADTWVRRGPLTIVGVDDDFSGHAHPDRALAGASGPMLALSHVPDVLWRLPRGVPVLAGHTHCGQMVLPLVGPLSRSHPPFVGRRLYDPRLRCGAIAIDGRRAIVTAGIGSGSIPLRIGAPPDWWLVTVGP